MSTTSRTLAGTACGLLLAVVVLLLTAGVQQPAGSDQVRVGVFARTPLLVAHYRSTAHAALLRRWRDERDAAAAKHDTAKVAEIEARGAALQDKAHRQLAGEAPLDNVLEAITTEQLAKAARDARVVLIVEKPLYAAPSVEQVDVTDRLVALFPSDTRER